MGQASRTTKLLLDLDHRAEGGANASKHAYLVQTVSILDAARAFYVTFFLAHPDRLTERVPYYSEQHAKMRERQISPNELLTWAESLTVATREHPHPLPSYNFSERFPGMPFAYRRSVIKDAIGKVRSHLSLLANWQATGSKKGQPGMPTASNLPTLYEGTFSLELGDLDFRKKFVRLKVYTGATWSWANYPVKSSHYFEQRRTEPGWEQQSPKLILRKKSAELHFPQTKEVRAKRIIESKLDPNLVTVAVDLNVRS
jgi:hypothetical protein